MKMPARALAFLGLVTWLSAGLAGCASTPAPEPTTPLVFEARVVHVPLEGGFYGLITTDEVRYEPRDLAPHLQRDGLRLQVQAEPADVASIRMWGRPIRILQAEPLSSGP